MGVVVRIGGRVRNRILMYVDVFDLCRRVAVLLLKGLVSAGRVATLKTIRVGGHFVLGALAMRCGDRDVQKPARLERCVEECFEVLTQ